MKFPQQLALCLFVCFTTLQMYTVWATEDHASQAIQSLYVPGEFLPSLVFSSHNKTIDLGKQSFTDPIIVVRFLGYRCTHCVQQLTYLNEYASKLKDLGISVYAFSSDDEEQCAALVKNLGYDTDVIHILSDPSGRNAQTIKADSLHASLVVHRGRILLSAHSDQPYMDIGRLVATAVVESESVQVLQESKSIDRYLTATVTKKIIAGPSDGVVEPIDLDFNTSPLHPNDLWVVTTSGGGHSMAIVHNAGQPNQVVRLKKDSRASHFMWRTTGIAMANNGTFATAQNGQNGSGDPFYQFMGPTLWSSDTAVFASRYQSDNQVLASHLDMLHQSPMCNGIAHDSASVYWVSDGHYGDVCRYDYQNPHEVGGTDHRDGIIRRYSDVKITKGVRGRPAHLDLDHASGWLYFVDPGANKVMRLNTRSGSFKGNLLPPKESAENYAEFSEWTGASVESIITQSVGEPVGIAVTNNRLLVGDRVSGSIHVYALDAQPIAKLGTIATGAIELLGICVDASDRIWFVDRGAGTVTLLQTDQDHEIHADIDVRVASVGEELSFQYTNASSTQRTVELVTRHRTVTPQGAGEWSASSPVASITVDGMATERVSFPIMRLDTLSATEFQLMEDNGSADGGVRAYTICVPRSLRRIVVDDAYMESFNISDAVTQTERPGYAMLRSDIFVSVSDSLDQLQTVLWNGGSFGEISVTDDAILNSLIERKVEVMLIADDPVLLRTDLPSSVAFFNRFGVSVVGADDATGDGGQRVFSGVPGDSISGGLSTVDCQYQRLNHYRGGDYVPGALYRKSKPEAVAVLKKNSSNSGCVRFDEGTYRTVVLGVNASTFIDGDQRTTLLRNSLIWLEVAAKADSVPDDTTTGVGEFTLTGPIAIQALGNPFVDVARIQIEGDAENVDVGIYTVGGQQLMMKSGISVHGRTEISFPLTSLASGTMFVIATSGNSITHCTIVKQ